MGVRGLTTYIAKNSEKYLKPYELHDCNLVIDGDSLATNLYKWMTNCKSAFGGDYDQYYRRVLEFFSTLQQCNITPYVLMDGGYQRKKLRTVHKRLRDRISAIKHINPINGMELFPLMMREVFVEAARTSGIHLMRCIFEADDEVAVLARKLNCPVLSFDSDFFIHNVQYIPMDTLNFKKSRRNVPRKNRRKPSVKPNEFKAYYYLECSVYTIKTLAHNLLDDSMLPLFATLVGNDYINAIVFRKFFANISFANIGKNNSAQQKRIIGVLRWLKNETLESAIEKVLDRVKKESRNYVAKQLYSAMSGYNRTDSKAFDFFNLDDNFEHSQSIDDTSDNSDDDVVDELNSNYSSDDVEQTESEDTPAEDEQDDEEDEDLAEEETSDIENEDEDKEISDQASDTSLQEETNPKYNSRKFEPPEWILVKILNAQLPRYTVDLLFLKMYINSPQIENFCLADSNEIALPIVRLIFSLLHYPEKLDFQYLTRVLRISNIHYKQIKTIDREFDFNPAEPKNLNTIKMIFDGFQSSGTDALFDAIVQLPANFQLYFLAIVYLAKQSKFVTTAAHIHSILVCFFVLSIADQINQPTNRENGVFQKRLQRMLSTGIIVKAVNDVATTQEFQFTSTATADGINDLNIAQLKNQLTIIDCANLQYNVMAHFQISDKIRRKHTEYSSTIIHKFAEFQATIFQMNSLNVLVNQPLPSIIVSQVFNGTFLYNMFVNLSDRPNILYYLKHYVFKSCPTFFRYYEAIYEICKPHLDCLNDGLLAKKKRRSRKHHKKKNTQTEANVTTTILIEDLANEIDTMHLNEDEHLFYDVNNKFACLVNG